MEDPKLPICDLCLASTPDGQDYYFKFPDVYEGGRDWEGFCCRACSEIDTHEQFKIMIAQRELMQERRRRRHGGGEF